MLKTEKRNYAKTFTLELYACEFCELCVQVCPTDAIVMMKSFDLSTGDRRELLLDKDRLHAIGLQFQPSWATGNRCATCRRRRRRRRPRAHAAGRRGMTAEVVDVRGARHRPGRLRAGRRAQQEPVPLRAVAGAGADAAPPGIFLMLDAEFLAAVQVLLYAGGVITIVVFAIVVTERLVGDAAVADEPAACWRGALAAAAFAGRSWSVWLTMMPLAADAVPRARRRDARPSAHPLLTRFVLPFELLAVLLLVGAARRDLLREAGGLGDGTAGLSHLAAVVFSIGLFGVHHAPQHGRHPARHRADAQRREHQPGRVQPLQRGHGGPAWCFTVFAICITVAEVALGLALVILLFRTRRTALADHIDLAQGMMTDPTSSSLIALLLPAAAFLLLALLVPAAAVRPARRRTCRSLVALGAFAAAIMAWRASSRSASRSRRVWTWLPGAARPAGLGRRPRRRRTRTLMLLLVTLVAPLVQIYSLGYLPTSRAPSLGRYYTYQSLFAFSMMGLVLAPNFLQLFVCWELVGLCSYLLIGFWYRKAVGGPRGGQGVLDDESSATSAC